MDNFQAEKELLLLRSESQETKYKELDLKIIAEIEKQATGQSRSRLLNMWHEDCKRNEDISKKRWQNKNQTWLNKYKENFKITYQNKDPFFKSAEETDRNKTYAEAATAQQSMGSKQRVTPTYQKSNTTQKDERQRRQCQNQGEAPAQETSQIQRPPIRQREIRLNETKRTQPSPRQEIPGTTSTVPIYIDLEAETGDNTQVNF